VEIQVKASNMTPSLSWSLPDAIHAHPGNADTAAQAARDPAADPAADRSRLCLVLSDLLTEGAAGSTATGAIVSKNLVEHLDVGMAG